MATYKISYAGGFDLELYISSGTQEVGNNRTYVYYRLRLIRTGSRTSNSSYNNPYTVNINGSQVASGTSTYSLSSSSTTRNLATGNVWVNHNADGRKTVAVSGTFRDQGGFLGGGTATRTVSGNTALKTIARASAPTTNISSVAAGSSFTVYTNRAASTFTHTVEVSLGTYKQTFTAVTTSRSVTMNSASSLGQMASVTSRNATISVKTYSGTTLVGTKSTTISVTVPTGITPTVGTLTATETVSAVSGLALATGAMVQGVSLPNLKVTGSTAGAGSSISSQTLDFDGVTTTNTDYVLSRPIVNSGTLPFKVTTRDARSRSTSKTLNVTVLPYAAPTAVVGSADRSTSTGTVSDTGTYLKVVLSGFVASLRNGTTQRNTLTLRIDSKLRGAADSTYVNHVNRAITVSTTEAWSRTETFTRTGGFAQSGSYVLRITVTDKLRSSVVIHNISTGQIALHFDANLGVGIGKYREQGKLDVGGHMHVRGNVNAVAGIYSGKVTAQGNVEAGGVLKSDGDVEAGGLLKGSGLSVPTNYYQGRILTTTIVNASPTPIPRFAYAVERQGDIVNGGTTGYHIPTKGRYLIAGQVFALSISNPGTYHYVEIAQQGTSVNHRFHMNVSNSSNSGKSVTFYIEMDFPGGTFSQSGFSLNKIGGGTMDIYGLTTGITSHILIRQISY